MNERKVFFVTFGNYECDKAMERQVDALANSVEGTELEGSKFIPLPCGVSLMRYDSEKPVCA